MRIGFVEYLNARPFLAKLPDQDITYAPPTKLNALLLDRQLDIALSSSVVALEHDLPYLPDFCIAAKERVYSVNLYTRTPKPSQIGLDSDSATSVELLKILCAHHWDIKAEFVPKSEEAFLLIGDQALHNPTIPGYQTIDLATAWYEMTGLPFVFALFTYHPTVDPTLFAKQLSTSLKWSETHLEELAQPNPKLLTDYYRACHYSLGSEEQQGLETFQRLRHVQPVCS